eukprot:scaffold4884_cov165-Amphora_coffeaeformis.AAC.7
MSFIPNGIVTEIRYGPFLDENTSRWASCRETCWKMDRPSSYAYLVCFRCPTSRHALWAF